MAFNPVLLAAMSDVAPSESGLASGVVNTAFMMGGALGLAVLASLAASRTDSLSASGDAHLAALNGGYHAAFLGGAIFAAAAAGVGAAFFRMKMPAAEAAHGGRGGARHRAAEVHASGLRSPARWGSSTSSACRCSSGPRRCTASNG